MSVTIMHIADCHLDTPFIGRQEHRNLLRDSQRKAFVLAIDTAIARSVDAVLIAGDLVDGDNLSHITVKLIHEQLSRLLKAGIPVCYAHGNHDPSRILSIMDIPEGVEVFRDMNPRRITICDRNGNQILDVVGVGFGQKVERTEPLGYFPSRRSLPTVGLVHTMPKDLGGGNLGFAPTSFSEMQNLHYDYWALGHIHERATYDRNIHFPGVLCGRDFSECGSHGVSIVTLEYGRDPYIETIDLAPVHYESLHLNIHEQNTLDDIYEMGFETITEVSSHVPGSQVVIRLILDGETAGMEDITGPLGEENLEDISRRLCQHTGALEVYIKPGSIHRPIAIEEYEDKPHLLSQVLKTLREVQENPERMQEVLAIVREIGFYQAKDDETSMERIRQLLPGLDRELCEMMIKEK